MKSRMTPAGGAENDWQLTPREGEVAELVAEGLTNRQIATRLRVTEYTVKKHLTRALAKTACRSRTQLAVAWFQQA
jgi:DNA-binding NarL/FixJ family response regulator